MANLMRLIFLRLPRCPVDFTLRVDATGWSRRPHARVRCHGLVPWSLTFLLYKARKKAPWMPRPCAVELHVRSYVAQNVKLHGTSPWHLVISVLVLLATS